ncbi:acyl-CoA thioesterase domain-containing protein [Actinomadura keratinilytica]|uniref:acyl-CoA thioesterase domain-containing protein n=1 Tax=Actinomadura keratinilytica TaxID=547461 RepID=UPI00361B6FAD
MKEFSRATAVRPRTEGDHPETGERRAEFDADLDAQWSVGDKLHGGYVLAVMARAAARTASPRIRTRPPSARPSCGRPSRGRW